MLEAEREWVAAAARRLASEGLVIGTAGNLSARHGGLIIVTPTGAVLERVTADQVVVVDLDGNPVQGELVPTSELGLHLGAYRRYGVGAVIHTHAPIATALASVLTELPVVHYQMLALGGPVRVAPYATFGTEELAALTLDALEGRSAALMSNHGAISLGADLDAAIENSLLLEWACTIYWRAASVGAPRVLDAAQWEDYHRAVAERRYRPLQRSGA
jgi:L-fuculose-phosphate aldolase